MLLLLYPIITPTGVGGKNRIEYMCRCDCGEEKTVEFSRLQYTKSCGCLKLGIGKKNTSHGHSAGGSTSPTYRTWVNIKGRCLYPCHKYYNHYGGRGITICDRWKDSFENFLADMGVRPEVKCTIDRIDNSKGYSPENCRWATMKEQQRNRTNNRIISAFGQDRPVCAWAEEYGISYTAILWRMKTLGWNAEKAISTPQMKRGPNKHGKKTAS